MKLQDKTKTFIEETEIPADSCMQNIPQISHKNQKAYT